MREAFERAAGWVAAQARGEEIAACYFAGEESDFVRFNKSALRQAGAVRQMRLRLQLIRGLRQAQADLTLSGEAGEDERRASRLLKELREMLPLLPEDPHLIYAQEVRSSERRGENGLPEAGQAVEAVLEAGRGRDLVGLYAAGGVHAGFANSLGQRNWFSSWSFNLDWSFYARADKAVKARYAGFAWDPAAFGRVVEGAGRELEAVSRPERAVPPGRYRAYLSPPAVEDFVGMVANRGFGLRARRTKRSSLLKMAEEGRRLHPALHLSEVPGEGFGPDFQEQGFLKAPRVPLIEAGALGEALVSPRSAKEYGVPTNGASEREAPESLDMAPGEIPQAGILERLGKGVWVGDLWYLNYSDLPSCRITGLTRFATFWVEGGEIAAPLRVMRFDESAYRVLGENLLGLTAERERFLDPGTYGGRSTRSSQVPGALVEGFALTL